MAFVHEVVGAGALEFLGYDVVERQVVQFKSRCRGSAAFAQGFRDARPQLLQDGFVAEIDDGNRLASAGGRTGVGGEYRHFVAAAGQGFDQFAHVDRTARVAGNRNTSIRTNVGNTHDIVSVVSAMLVQIAERTQPFACALVEFGLARGHRGRLVEGVMSFVHLRAHFSEAVGEAIGDVRGFSRIGT